MRKLELTPIHDFGAKLRQSGALAPLAAYVRWQAALRGTLPAATGIAMPPPTCAPLSINLDITTACNYACDHCVDADILNTRERFQHDTLLDSLSLLAQRGLRSVIMIGGGEPTLYPRFVDAVRHLKSLGLQVGIVSNGSRMARLLEIGNILQSGDWIRLSLDAGSDALFQRMHRPKQPVSLDAICEGARALRMLRPAFRLGYSFIVTWPGACIHQTEIADNIDEIPLAAERARDSGFDYIVFKPFLTRAEENRAEVVDERFASALRRITTALARARETQSADFQLHIATNLKAILAGESTYTEQPSRCHMQFFRQVLSPLGIFNCPVYRSLPRGRLGDRNAYASEQGFASVLDTTMRQIETFDASRECRQVTCLYHEVNWWIESLIADPGALSMLENHSPEVSDYFL